MRDILESRERISGSITNVRATYLFYYMALGTFLPFITLYYERMGLTGLQIGTLVAIPMLVGALTSLFWGAVSDAFRVHRIILNLALLLTPLAVFMLSTAREFSSFILIISIYAIFNSPIVPILDSNALEVVKIHHHTYGGLRVYGSIGWSISTFLVGMVIEKSRIQMIFYCYILLLLFTFGLSIFQPRRSSVLRSSLRQGLRSLLQPVILFFLASILLLTMTTNAINSFLSIYLDHIGTAESYIGLAWALASLSEVPVMIFSGALMQRIGAGGLLKLAFITIGLRALLFSFIQVPVWALCLQIIYGFSFTAFLVGGVTYINQHAPEGLSTTAQAIFSAISFGFGSMLGAMLGGYLYDMVGLPNLFRILSLLPVLGLAIFLLSSKIPLVKREEGMVVGK